MNSASVPNLEHVESFSQVLKDVVSFLPRFLGDSLLDATGPAAKNLDL